MYTSVKLVHESNSNKTFTIEELNEELYQLHIPAIIFVAVCMVVGITGNVFVLFVYKNKFKRSNHRYFILFLAIIDLLACLTGVPYLVASLRLPYLMTSAPICKTVRYIHYFVNNSSGLLLVFISIERYRKICRPFKAQLTPRQTMYFCCIPIAISAVLAIPAPIFFGANNISTGIGNITGTQCYVQDNYKGTVYFELFMIVLMAEAALSIIVLAILYAFIVRKLLASDHFIEAMRSMQSSSSSKSDQKDSSVDNGTPDEMYSENESEALNPTLNNEQHAPPTAKANNDNSLNGQKVPMKIEKKTFSRSVSDLTATRIQNSHKFNSLTAAASVAARNLLRKSAPFRNGSGNSKLSTSGNKVRKSRTTIRVTIMLFTVSIIFAVAFIPHLTLMIVTFHVKGFLDSLGKSDIMAYQLFLRIFIVNNVANPIVYLFCDTKFRQHCKNILRKCHCFKGKSVSITKPV